MLCLLDGQFVTSIDWISFVVLSLLQRCLFTCPLSRLECASILESKNDLLSKVSEVSSTFYRNPKTMTFLGHSIHEISLEQSILSASAVEEIGAAGSSIVHCFACVSTFTFSCWRRIIRDTDAILPFRVRVSV